jgi:hypothetical protein
MRALVWASLILAGGAVLHQLRPRSACERTLAYSLGELDGRFAIGRDAALLAARRAADLWEEAAGRKVFRYDPRAPFAIHLHFDDRQETSVAAKAQRARIESGDRDLQELHGRYEALRAAYDAQRRGYESDVGGWNARGGAPAAELERLNGQRQQLRAMVEQLNGMAGELRPLASSLRTEVDSLNAKTGRAFDRGDFKGSRIDIYQFDDEKDLSLLLTHELGHALGVQHQPDPAAIMHFARTAENSSELALTDADRKGLRRACGERSFMDWRR